MKKIKLKMQWGCSFYLRFKITNKNKPINAANKNPEVHVSKEGYINYFTQLIYNK